MIKKKNDTDGIDTFHEKTQNKTVKLQVGHTTTRGRHRPSTSRDSLPSTQVEIHPTPLTLLVLSPRPRDPTLHPACLPLEADNTGPT